MSLARRVTLPYIVMTVVLFLLAIMIKNLLCRRSIRTRSRLTRPASLTEQASFSYPHLLLGVLCLFLYVGVEVIGRRCHPVSSEERMAFLG